MAANLRERGQAERCARFGIRQCGVRCQERFHDMVRMNGPDSLCIDCSHFDQAEPLFEAWAVA
jgi:hypothetical protein